MGLAPHLADTYRRYKRGTENVVQWLAGTARATGEVEDVFTTGLQDKVPVAGRRLKGKARRKAKDRLDTNTATHQISISVFVKLAKAISSASNVDIPRSVLTTLSAVIRGRKGCAAWYLLNQDDADDSMKANNDRHQHFIQILEETLHMLNEKRAKQRQSSQSTEDARPKEENNMFNCLELEDTDDSEEIPDWIPVTVRVKKDVDYKLEESDSDLSFAVYCFLKDLTNIRLFVRRTWRDFKHGKIGLQAAALTTNAAIGMIEVLSNDFGKANSRFKKTANQYMHPRIIDYIYQGYCSQQGSSPFIDVEAEEHDVFAYNEDGQTLHSSTVMCVHTMDLLVRQFFHKDSKHLRLSVDEKRFIKCISQLAAFKTKSGRPYQDDMVHKAAYNMMHAAQLDTWNIFAMQILWDTQRELGDMLPIAHLLIEKRARDMAQSYDTYLGMPGLDQVGEIHKKHRAGMQARRRFIDIIVLDSKLQLWLDRDEERVSWKFAFPKFCMLDVHPAMCGLILQDLCDEHQRTAINIAGCQGQILVAAHLYNAAHSSGLLPESAQWSDMDHFIEKQGSEWIFVGKRPKDAQGWLRHLSIAMGLSPEKFAKDYKNPKSGRGSDGRYRAVGKIRHFEYLARYSELGHERIDNHFKKPTEKMSPAGLDITVMADTMARDSLGLDKTATLSSLATLHAFKKAVDTDESAFNFDVMYLYLQCIRLLRSIQEHCMESAPQDYPRFQFGHGLGMNACINEMISHCDGWDHLNRPMFPDAVQMLRAFIEHEGGHVLYQAKTQEEEINLKQIEPQTAAEPSFENPFEDMVGLELRNMYSSIFFQDGDGTFRMPFA